MRRTTLAVVALGCLLIAAPASAHVTVTPEEAAADGYAKLDFSVPHGCDGSPTTRLRVQIPESVPSVTPQVHPGWSLETKEGPKDEVELFGETITRGVSEVTWTAERAPLPDHYLDVFGMQVRLPATEGETLHFPAIQECQDGEIRWIQIPAEGENEEDLEEPAPAVTLTAAAAESDDAAHADADSSGEATSEETAAEEDDDAPMGLAVAGVVLGGLGLVAGGASLLRRRQG